MSFVFCFLYRYSAFVCSFICWVCLWMSAEGSDSTYQPKRQKKWQGVPQQKRPIRSTRRERDYSEPLLISDESEEETLQGESTLSDSDTFTSESISIKSEPWTPNTLASRIDTLFQNISELKEQASLSMMAKGSETGMNELIAMMLKMQADNDKRALEREDKREEERLRREEQQARREDTRDRETREMIAALKVAQPPVPQTVHIENTKLPRMTEGEDVEVFLDMFEAALVDNNIPENKWRGKVHASLDTATKLKVRDLMKDPTVTYQDLKDALIGCGALTFSNASETLMTADRNKLLSLPLRQAIHKWHRLLEKMSSEATTISESCMCTAVAIARYHLDPDLKRYIDVKGEFSKEKFCQTADEWQANQPPGTKWSKRSDNHTIPYERSLNKQVTTKKILGTCFHCGKQGHYSKQCRTRIAEERDQQVSRPFGVKQEPTPETTQTSKPKRDITCFNCRQTGHKSPQCPLRIKQVKKINIPANKVVPLARNEVFGSMGKHRLPITCDTGAQVTLVPEECVEPIQFTGETCVLATVNDTKFEGKRCEVDITIDDRVFHRKAVTQPGKLLHWTVCLSIDMGDRQEGLFVLDQMGKRAKLKEEEALYLPPEIKDGAVLSGVMVSEGNLVEQEEEKVEGQPVQAITREVEPEVQSVQQVHDSQSKYDRSAESDEVEGEREVSEQILEDEQTPSDVVEVEGDTLGGSAEEEVKDNLSVEGMRQNIPRADLAQAIKEDKSLAQIYNLGEQDKEGYHIVEGILFRTRLDVFGQTVEQICMPTSYRQHCLTLAHNNFGHQGRTKMVELIKPYFYWPNMTKDCLQHVRACDTCQRTDKTTPQRNCMQEREIATIPFESVAIDLVGPFPTAVGGFRFLLTCVDNATRWPEAIPIRKITARTIITQLTSMFTKCGFPSRLTSDNGTQFTGKTFQDWLRRHGIKHVRSTPYHPQGNGVVERLHRTLNNMITKITQSKGNWATITPMALYFIRCTPSATTGISPFLARHGWEPSTPLQVLYKTWVQQDLGDIDLTEWVNINAERIEIARDKSLANKLNISQKRKHKWDLKAVNRSFEIDDEVLVRKPGLNSKLSESWEGPYRVIAKNSPLSYKIDTGDRRLNSVHIQLIKRYDRPKQVKRVTSVLEGDTEQDDITTRYSEAKVEEQQLRPEQQQQLQTVLDRHTEVLTDQPGLTRLVKFSIDTGSEEPIFQRAYSTPAALKQSVDKEIDWLLSQNYIRPSRSPWSSPMVTVKKPDGSARLCVDFRRINEITRQMPFYMPRVEEVLEGVGKASYISKMDLCKGYYQVEMEISDIPKTAFICHRGKFEFLRMPFGVKNAPAAFQELMQTILNPYKTFTTAYMDDIVVFSDSWENHLNHIDVVLTALSKAGLTANPRKCRWGGKSIEFLGHQVGGGEMSVPLHRVQALSSYNRPTTKKGLRAFLGSIGFYRRYVEKLANQTAILTPLTAKQAPQRVEWTDEGMLAFSNICDFISNACALCIPLPSDIFSVVTDASGKGVGGILQVLRDDEWQPAAFYSRQLRGAEQRYSATELEALALVSTIEHFSYYLYGNSFKAYTDHKPLEQLTTSHRLNPRLRRMAYKLQHWLITIQYIPGNENTLADALSREERRRMPDEPDTHLASGDVEGQPPQQEEEW